MHGKLRRRLFHRVKHSAVGNYNGVHAYFSEIFKVVGKRRKIGVARKDICRNVYFFAVTVRKSDGFFQFFAVEIVGKRAQRKGFAPYICRVRAEIDGGPEF